MTAFRAYAPTGLEQSADYHVTASVPGIETELYCAHATVGNRFKDYSMSYEKMTFCSLDWDFSAPLTIRVKPSRSWKEVIIRPVHAGIPYTIEGDTVVITLTEPQKFSLPFGCVFQPVCVQPAKEYVFAFRLASISYVCSVFKTLPTTIPEAL